MVKVAIAGGSGMLGTKLVAEFAKQSKHEAVILTRKSTTPPPPPSQPPSPTKKISVVICTFGITPTSLSISQRNLILACAASSTVTRFIPTSFAIPYPRSGITLLPPLKDYFDCLDLLSKTDLEWCTVNNGIFLDYYMPEADNMTLVLDIENHKAAVPGRRSGGVEKVSFMWTEDVARFVIAALDLEIWPKGNEMRVVGDTVSFEEFLGILEEVMEGVEFEVVYDEKILEELEVTELPGHKRQYGKFPKEILLPFLAVFERWMVEGRCEVSREGSLNEIFPEIRALGVREMVERYWKDAS